MKTCYVCHRMLPISAFGLNKAAPSGLDSKCKECGRTRKREWRKNNAAEYKERQRVRYAAGAAEYKERQRARYIANPVGYKTRALLRKKRTRRAMLPGYDAAILAIYDHMRDCRAVTGEDYHVDHIVPLIHPLVCGLHVPWNLQVLPSDINVSKGHSWIDTP